MVEKILSLPNNIMVKSIGVGFVLNVFQSWLVSFFFFINRQAQAELKHNQQLKATASLPWSFDEVIEFSFSELVSCLKLICKTKLILKQKR